MICAPPKRKNHALKILQDQRQRRRTADDSKFRLRPTALPADRKGFQNLGFGTLLGTFPARGKYPAGGRTRRFICLSAPKRRNSPITKTGRTRAVTLVRPVFKIKKTLQCPPPAIIFSPCPSAGSTALRFSRVAFSEPGRFTSSVPPRVPATARESIACGVICRLA